MRILRRAMPEGEFWELIDLLDGSTDDDAVARLTEALRARGRRTAVAFQERLAATLHDLDREVLARQQVRWADSPDEVDDFPMSDDVFLYLRAGVVAQGREAVEQVKADPSALLARPWDEGELLLYAAQEAAGEEIETELSYETGSNEAHWTPVDVGSFPHRTPVVATLLADLLAPIEAYADEEMTVPLDPPLYAWPRWVPGEVLRAAAEVVDSSVRDNGGVPAELGVEQIQVVVGLGEAWRLTPEITWKVEDDTGLGQVTRAHVEMRQSDVRSWAPAEQVTALRAAVAGAVLAVLPAQHAGGPDLAAAVRAGSNLLPG